MITFHQIHRHAAIVAATMASAAMQTTVRAPIFSNFNID